MRRFAGTGARVQRLPLELLWRRAAARGVGLRLGELRAQPRDQARRRLALHREARGTAAQLVRDRQRRLALSGSAGQLLFDAATLDEELVELRLRRSLQRALGAEQPREHLPGTFCTRLALDRSDPCRLARFERRTLELRRLDTGIARVRRRVGEIHAHAFEESRRRLAANTEPLGRTAEAVQHLHRLLALPCSVGELLFRTSALLEHGLELLLRRAPRHQRRGTPAAGFVEALVERLEIELGDACPQLRELAAQLLRALGGGRLQRKRTQPLLHLVFEVARALDLHADA